MAKTIDKNFAWGAATASYQIEGGFKQDGRGLSIWDTFSHTPGKTFCAQTGDVTCDHYNRYIEDVALMKSIGLKAYRFSIAWSRIFPTGDGAVNQKGVDFYNNLINELLKNGIEPYVTLYHWDLPQALEDVGGWDNRKTIELYVKYAQFAFDTFGDRVKKWITLNEPWVAAYLGNWTGVHAPGKTDFALAVRISHNFILAHAKAVIAYRSCKNNNGVIGIALNLNHTYPYTDSADDIEAAKVLDGNVNRWFLDAIMNGNYPEDTLKLYAASNASPDIHDGDMKTIASAKIDFLGVNNYFREIVKKSNENYPLNYTSIKPEGAQYTEMGWEVYPDGIYQLLMRIKRDYNNPRMYITENGVAFNDKVVNGDIKDDDRIEYLRTHIGSVERAMADGADINGYFVWSLMDNFEWACGFRTRFGIIRVDYDTCKRTLKHSALWYKNRIEQSNR